MLHDRSTPLVPGAGDRGEQPPIRYDRPIGQLLCQMRGMQPQDVEQVLEHQRRYGGRFGAVAIGLGLASEEDILAVLAGQFGYPCAGSAGDRPVDPELVCAGDPLGADAQCFRELRTELLAGVLSSPRALAVVGAQRGEGRSYVAANLAVALAQLGGTALLVDADMRDPRQHTLFGLPGSSGLSQMLSGRVVHDGVQPAPGIAGLFVVGAGPVPPNPTELLQRPAFADLLRQWVAGFGYVVVDTPPANAGPDGRIAAAAAGAALVVAQPHAARMADLQRLVGGIEKAPVALAGVVMNEH